MTRAISNAAMASTSPRAGGRVYSRAWLRGWLWGLAGLVLAMVAIGGATRLTGSGLSITEWKPVTGAIPPLTETAWASEFAKYRASPQYSLLNQGMALGDFKTIYWWEWGHRQLGRFLGLFYLAPFLWFWLKGALSGRLAGALLIVGALGGLQAAVGWIMVASGLEPGMTAVAPLKLMLHLTLASLILASLVWLAVGAATSLPGSRLLPRSASARKSGTPDLRGEGGERSEAGWGASRAGTVRTPSRFALGPSPQGRDSSRLAAFILLGLVLVQIALGGLVAGSKAGLTFNTWPLMDGRLVPPAETLFAVTPWIENFVDNVALVQVNHRLMAYIVIALALWHAFEARGTGRAGRRAAVLAALCLVQGALGVATLLLGVPLWAGLAHQLLAMAVLGMATAHARLT